MISGNIAKQYLDRFPDSPTLTIAKIMQKENPEFWGSVENARSALRFYRGNMGKNKKNKPKDKKYLRENGKAGFKYELPASLAIEWLPYDIKIKNKILLISDIHIPFHDFIALKTIFDFSKEFNPSIILFNGDIIDCYSISKFEKNPKHRFVKDELNAFYKLLDYIFNQHDKVKILYKFGNHEDRYKYYLWTHSEALFGIKQIELSHILQYDESGNKRYNNFEIIEDGRIINVSNMPILHGNEFFKGLTNPVNPARGVFLRGISSCIVSHWHKTSEHTEQTLKEKLITTKSIGCVCYLHPEYSRLNKWNHGFATIDLKGEKLYNIENYRIYKGKILN